MAELCVHALQTYQYWFKYLSGPGHLDFKQQQQSSSFNVETLTGLAELLSQSCDQRLTAYYLFVYWFMYLFVYLFVRSRCRLWQHWRAHVRAISSTIGTQTTYHMG